MSDGHSSYTYEHPQSPFPFATDCQNGLPQRYLQLWLPDWYVPSTMAMSSVTSRAMRTFSSYCCTHNGGVKDALRLNSVDPEDCRRQPDHIRLRRLRNVYLQLTRLLSCSSLVTCSPVRGWSQITQTRLQKRSDACNYGLWHEPKSC